MPRFVGRVILALVSCCVGAAPTLAQESESPLCPMLILDEKHRLEDAVLADELARSRFATYEEIYELIKGLWDADAVERMAYLEAKYDRDSYRLALERAALVVEAQRALVEQYELACAEKEQAEVEEARSRYRTALCAEQAKAIEIAEVDLEYDRLLLDSVRDLFAGEVATKTDVILAELEVALDRTRLANARRRADRCRQELAPAEKP